MEMLHSTRVIVCASVALAETAICAAPTAAQSVAEFYKGKTIAILMGTQPGGSYDLYGRVIGEHLSRYITGNPTIIMEHMPGAAVSSRATISTVRDRRTALRSCSRTRSHSPRGWSRRACVSNRLIPMARYLRRHRAYDGDLAQRAGEHD
jgi:hypothetical protein